MDRDSYAIKVSDERLAAVKACAKYKLVNSNFKNIAKACSDNGIESVDGVLLDLGVSSHQLDEAERGFSYQKDARLDMRMDRREGLDAETIVNTFGEGDIKRIIADYGEEKWASRVAQFIVAARQSKTIQTTFELVEIIKAAIPSSARREGPHPAKRTFQALRIAVNNELGILEETIDGAVKLLKPGGRLCIITFHSLEDRIVKNAFQRKINPCTCPRSFPICICGKKVEVEYTVKNPILPSDKELEENPRSRSAKLRTVRKILT